MRVSDMHVISVTNNLQTRHMWQHIYCLNMKVGSIELELLASILAISVTTKLQNQLILQNIFSLNMKV